MKCPMCEKDADTKYRPFCSKHCSDVDLHKWLTNEYAIPGNITDEEDSIAADLLAPESKIH